MQNAKSSVPGTIRHVVEHNGLVKHSITCSVKNGIIKQSLITTMVDINNIPIAAIGYLIDGFDIKEPVIYSSIKQYNTKDKNKGTA